LSSKEKMAYREQSAVALIEHDTNGDVMCVWSYPSVSLSLQSACIKLCSSDNEEQTQENITMPSFFYFKVKSDWIYVSSRDPIKEFTPDITKTSLCVVTKVFNPEKYQSLLDVLLEQYITSGDPTKILEAYLSVYATGKYANKGGSYDISTFKDSSAMLAVSEMLEISRMLGLETIILWNAILLKKRILVTSDNVIKLQAVMRTLPQFAIHRQDWSILRPLIQSDNDLFLDDIRSSGVYIAGSLDTSLAGRTDLFDVVLSLADRRISILEHAAQDMRMCSTHRDVGQIFQEDGSGYNTNQEIIKALASKTSQIVGLLNNLAEQDGKLTENAIRGRVSNEATQQWLYRVGIAEGLV
jgi:hypothetical protein